MKKHTNIFISSIIIIIAFYLNRNQINVSFFDNFNLYELLFIFIFLIANLIKSMRLYIIMFDEKMPLGLFMFSILFSFSIGLLTTFIVTDLIIFVTFYKSVQNKMKLLTYIFMNRFFDFVILSMLFIIFDILYLRSFSIITFVFSLMWIIFILIALSYESFYKFLNQFLVTKSFSKRSLYILKISHKINNYYMHFKSIFDNKFSFLVILSLVAWIIEFYSKINFYQLSLTINSFSIIMKNTFFNGESMLLFNFISSIFILFLMLFLYFIRRRRII
jgi:hypothetical protein